MKRHWISILSVALCILSISCVFTTNEQICLRNLENQMYMCMQQHPRLRQVEAKFIAGVALSEKESARTVLDLIILSCAIGLEKVRQCKEAPDADWPAINTKM